MELIWQSLLTMDWWVPAVCDVIALLCVIGAIALWRTRSNTQAQTGEAVRPSAPAIAFPSLIETDPSEDTLETETEPAPAPRADVKRALAAIGRWEDSYRSGRGVAELARFVETQRTSREAARR